MLPPLVVLAWLPLLTQERLLVRVAQSSPAYSELEEETKEAVSHRLRDKETRNTVAHLLTCLPDTARPLPDLRLSTPLDRLLVHLAVLRRTPLAELEPLFAETNEDVWLYELPRLLSVVLALPSVPRARPFRKRLL